MGLEGNNNNPETNNHLTNPKVINISDNTKDKVNDALILLNGVINKYPFIIVGKNGEILINYKSTNFSKEAMKSLISEIIDDKKGFIGLDYKQIENLIYGDIKSDKPIKIANGVKKLYKSVLKTYYEGIYEEKDGELLLKLDNFDDEKKSILKNLLGEKNFENSEFKVNFSDFFAYLWSEKLIRYGLNYQALIGPEFNGIKRELLNGNTIKIASNKKPVDDKEDEVNLGLQVKFSKFRKNITQGKKSVIPTYDMQYPRVKKGEIILKIKIGNNGHTGIDIKGKEVEYNKAYKINEEKFIYEGAEYITKEVEEQDGNKIITLIAKEDIYLNFVRNPSSGNLEEYEKGKAIGIAVGINEIINLNTIGPETGNIEVKNDSTSFHQKGKISEGYYIKGLEIILSDTELLANGRVVSTNDIILMGKNNICNGSLQSINGNVYLSSKSLIHTNSKIFAINGRVTINGNIEHTTIIANEILIKGNATGSTLIARKIDIQGEIRQKCRLRGENIKIKSDTGDNEIVLILFYAIDKFKRHIKLSNLNKDRFKAKINQLKELILEKRKYIDILRSKFLSTEDYELKKNISNDRLKTLREIDILKTQGDNLIAKINEDKEYSSRIENFLEFFEDNKDTDILNINYLNINSDIILHPTGVIFDDNQHLSLNPNDFKNRAKNKLLFLHSLNEYKFTNDKKINLDEKGKKISITHKKGYDLIKDHIISKNNEGYNNVTGNRLDERRYVIMKVDPNIIYKNNGTNKISEAQIKNYNLIKVSIDGLTDSYINDLSMRGSSFVIDKKNDIHEINSSIDVKFDLKTDKCLTEVKSTFWITRIEEYEHYKKISGFFIGSMMESDIGKYLNYLEIKNNNKKSLNKI
ncbi:MAG: hypothetical protein Q8K30_00105 [Candidatus Gracilibacteria bacterium]|nr:hypothetical protein [Candidatus Gracilibacteria bacterium]